MMRPCMRSGLALTMILCWLCATTLLHAAEDTYTPRSAGEPSTEAMLADGLLLRPAGVVATLLGSLAFVVTLPFTIPTKSVEKAAQKFVLEPANYTFTRPFGHVKSPRPLQE